MAGMKQPADKSHFLLPDLGEGLAEAELIRWTVKPGDAVKESQTIAEMQTDKALVEVPSPWAGTISELCGKEGEVIKVGAVLVRYAVGKAAAPAAAPVAAKAGAACMSSQVAAAVNGTEQDQGTVVGTMAGTLSVSDRFARRQAEHLAAPAEPVRQGKPLATPAVRGIARKLGVDLSRVNGTGRGGRVTASDVEAHANGLGAKASAMSPGFAPKAMPVPTNVAVDKDGVSQRIPFRGVRRKIAEALTRSVQTAVHFTAMDEADVTELDRRRREYSKVVGEKLSMLPFIMTAVTKALRKHPSLNANVDDANSEILIKGVINLGIAVDTDAGLMVPVLRDADRKSIVQLAGDVKTLASRCKDRSISREESLGGTFTISIINYPEVAILAAGRTREKVLAKDGKIYAGLSLPLSISADHRVVDGAEAVRFLNEVIRLLESPELLVS
jgi:pyruvate dehydrogenase E2 component (dihydrolipoamide acetyltransferase)